LIDRRGVGAAVVAAGAEAGVATATVTGVGENAGVDVGNRAGAGGVMNVGALGDDVTVAGGAGMAPGVGWAGLPAAGVGDAGGGTTAGAGTALNGTGAGVAIGAALAAALATDGAVDAGIGGGDGGAGATEAAVGGDAGMAMAGLVPAGVYGRCGVGRDGRGAATAPREAGVTEIGSEPPAMAMTPPHTEQRARTPVAGTFAGSTRKTDRQSGQETVIVPALRNGVRCDHAATPRSWH
jgi:hypothetical protein